MPATSRFAFRASLVLLVAVALVHLALLARAPLGHFPDQVRHAKGMREPRNSDLHEPYLRIREFLLCGDSPYVLYRSVRRIPGECWDDSLVLRPDEVTYPAPYFWYPLHAVIPLGPFALMPFKWAIATFGIFAFLIVWGCTWWWVNYFLRDWSMARRMFVLTALMSVMPSLAVELLRQPAVLVYLSATVTFAMLERGRPAWAGAALVLATVKPQICLAPIVLLALLSLKQAELRRMLLSFGLVLATVLLVFQIWSPNWVAEWVVIIIGYPHPMNPLQEFVRERALFDTAKTVGLVLAAGLAVALVLIGKLRGKRAFYALNLGFLLSVSSGDSFQVYHHTLMIPAVLALLALTSEAQVLPRTIGRGAVATCALLWSLGTLALALEFLGWAHLVPGLDAPSYVILLRQFPFNTVIAAPVVVLAGTLLLPALETFRARSEIPWPFLERRHAEDSDPSALP